MIIDFDLDFLNAAVAMVDTNLARLEKDVPSSADADAFGILDELEYVTGFGFVACQTYLTAMRSRSQLKNKKREALALGPKHRTGRSMAQLVNEAANYWKHSPEWSLEAPSPQAEQTIEVISSLGVTTDTSYPIANVLHEILRPHPARFVNLVPFLTQWRTALPR